MPPPRWDDGRVSLDLLVRSSREVGYEDLVRALASVDAGLALRADSSGTFLVVARHTGADAEPIVWISPSRPALAIEASRLLPHGSPEGPDLPWWVELIASSGAAGSAELAQLVARALAAALDGWTAQLSVAEMGAP